MRRAIEWFLEILIIHLNSVRLITFTELYNFIILTLITHIKVGNENVVNIRIHFIN